VISGDITDDQAPAPKRRRPVRRGPRVTKSADSAETTVSIQSPAKTLADQPPKNGSNDDSAPPLEEPSLSGDDKDKPARRGWWRRAIS
jgi:hypothetical protein